MGEGDARQWADKMFGSIQERQEERATHPFESLLHLSRTGRREKEGQDAPRYRNRNERGEAIYKDGKIMTAIGWKPNGEKCPVTNVVDGNGVWVWYNDDGTEGGRTTFKDGESVTP